jgi:hypothetical protein
VKQALDGINDEQLLSFIKAISKEFSATIELFEPQEYAPEIPNNYEPMESAYENEHHEESSDNGSSNFGTMGVVTD